LKVLDYMKGLDWTWFKSCV